MKEGFGVEGVGCRKGFGLRVSSAGLRVEG